jgi:enoyl-CoA hydratase/carnithine racemase
MRLRKRKASGFSTAYEHLIVTRSQTGVITVRLHTDGGPVTISDTTRAELSNLLDDVATDEEGTAMILAGTGDHFIAGAAESATPTIAGRRIPAQLGELEMPVIAAVNGSVRACCEYALLADIVIASETAEFSGLADAIAGLGGSPAAASVPSWLLLIERSDYYALASRAVTAEDARRCGVVAETHPTPRVLPRALELAEALAAHPERMGTYLRDVIREDAGTSSTGSTPIGTAFGRLALVDLEGPSD